VTGSFKVKRSLSEHLREEAFYALRTALEQAGIKYHSLSGMATEFREVLIAMLLFCFGTVS
jgi:hypothetical protein